MNEKSLANLALGRKGQGKLRRNYTLMPETIDWLDSSGNASKRLDELVSKVKEGKLVHTDQDSELAQSHQALEEQTKAMRKTILEIDQDLDRCVKQKMALQDQVKNQADAIAVLKEALTLKANAGGAIKSEIRKALELLE